MKIKTCTHPEPRSVSVDNEWCPACGALSAAGAWQSPALVTNPRGWIVGEAHDLPIHAERRAWEAFAAANLPFAATVVTAEAGDTDRDVTGLTNALAAKMADRMMGSEWSARFGGDDEGTDASGG